MTKVSCILIITLLIINCGTKPNRDEIAAQGNAKIAALKMEYEKNFNAALDLKARCSNILTNDSVFTLMKFVKENIDAGCQLNISQMEIISQVWDLAISRSVYLNDTNPNVELMKYKLEIEKKGMNLVNEASYDCIFEGMQKIRELNGQEHIGFNELLDYYALYSQIFNLSNDPSGSLRSYNENIDEFMSEMQKLSSKLDIIL